jgi:hypothetical protein
VAILPAQFLAKISKLRILATKYYARGRKNFPAKKLSIWFLAGKFFLLFFLSPLTFLSLLVLLLLQLRLPVVATRCLYCCCLRILEPGGLNCWPLGCWAAVFPLDYENNFNFDELWGRGILTENFLAGGRSRTAERWVAGPSSYPLDHEVVVERIILELPDEVWGRGILTLVMSRNLNRKYSKSKSLTLVGPELLVLYIKLGSPVSQPTDHGAK